VDTHLYVDIAKRAGIAWVEDRAPSMGAALAFYSAFSLAPLLIIVIALAGVVFGVDTVREALVDQLAGLVGPRAAEAVRTLLEAAQGTSNGAFATTVGVAAMLIGATTIMVELQDDLDHIWKAPRRTGNGLLAIFRARILSLGLILGIGFLLLVSLAWTGAMAAFGAYFESSYPATALLILHVSNQAFSFGATAVLFAMLYKWLPNVSIAWKDVWMGALITAVLFSGGRIVIGIYLGRSAVASAYGAAGTLSVLLLWLYYSAQVFLLGAEFTHLYARHRAARPQSMARADPSCPKPIV